MRVDEPRNKDVLRELYAFVVGELPCSLRQRKKLLDDATAHRDGMMLENCARRLDRYDPAGAEEGPYLGVP